MEFRDSIKKISHKFKTIGFELLECQDLGMHKYAVFTNDQYKLSYTYNRGGIELVARIKNDKRLDIIALLNWLYETSDKYQYLRIGQLDDEQTISYYGEIFIHEFDCLHDFLIRYTEQDINRFENYQRYEGAKQWSQVFKNKGKSIPESLKNILNEKGKN